MKRVYELLFLSIGTSSEPKICILINKASVSTLSLHRYKPFLLVYVKDN